MPDEEKLTTATRTGLRNGWFDNLYLVDAEARGFQVERIEERGKSGPFWDRKIKLDLVLSPPQRLALEEVQKRVHAALESDREFWEAGNDLDELKGQVRNARSVEEIARWLS